MRIGMMLRTLDEQYGIGMYTRYLLGELLALDRRNEYVLIYRRPEHLGKYADHPNVEEILLPGSSKLIWDQLSVPLLARRRKLDLIFHTKFTVPLVTRCKTVMVLHGSEWFVHPEMSPWLDIQYVKLMMPRYVGRADGVVSVSNRAKADIERYTRVDPDKVRTVHLAANERFRVIDDTTELERARAKHGLPERYLLFVGKIYPGKNLGNVLRAFARVRERIPHKLVICGDVYWKYEQDLALLDELGLADDVVRLGWVHPDDLPGIYNLADALVFPSFYESCPAPPWEAMACATPVVASPTGGTAEVVGDAALFVEPTDVEGIAEAIRRVLTDAALREDLVRKGFEQVARFSWARCARETLDFVEEIGAR